MNDTNPRSTDEGNAARNTIIGIIIALVVIAIIWIVVRAYSNPNNTNGAYQNNSFENVRNGTSTVPGGGVSQSSTSTATSSGSR